MLLTSREIQDMRRSSEIITNVERLKQQQMAEDSKNQMAQVARLRKERMLALEAEHERNRPLTKQEQVELEAKRQLIERATKIYHENLDDVKTMNTMLTYAKCATIRDAQLEEKARLKEEQKREDMRMALALEARRLEEMDRIQSTERARSAKQRQGARVVITQIEERQQQRLLDDEKRKREAEELVAVMKEQELKEQLLRDKKLAANRRLNEEVIIANREQEKVKMQRKELVRLEDLKIAEYTRQKDAREEARDKELARIKLEKELEIIRMRSLQEKSNDLQSQRDELRAKRHQEGYDRQWREKELEEVRKQQALNTALKAARDDQQRDKMQLLREKKVRERQEYLHALETQKAIEDSEKLDRVKEAERQRKQRADILSQIAVHEAAKAEARKQILQDAREVQADLAYEKELVTNIKAMKLREMTDLGVPVKYQAELQRQKVMVTSYARDTRK